MYPKILASYIEGNIIWFIPYGMKGVFSYNVENGEGGFLFDFTEIVCKKDSFRTLIKAENKLILAPYTHNQFLIYDLEKREYHTYTVQSEKQLRFSSAVCYEDSVYFICQDPVVAKYDINTGDVELFWGFQSESFCKQSPPNNVWSRGIGCVIGQDILIPNVHNSVILKWNMRDDDYSLIEVNGLEGGISSITSIDDTIWLLPRKGSSLYYINEQNNELSSINVGIELTEYYHMHHWRNSLIIMNYWDGSIMQVNILDKTIKNINKVLEITKDRCLEQMQIRWGDIIIDKLYVSMLEKNGIVQLDLQKETVDIFPMKIADRKVLDNILFHRQFVYEGEPYCSLEDFIHNLELQ